MVQMNNQNNQNNNNNNRKEMVQMNNQNNQNNQNNNNNNGKEMVQMNNNRKLTWSEFLGLNIEEVQVKTINKIISEEKPKRLSDLDINYFGEKPGTISGFFTERGYKYINKQYVDKEEYERIKEERESKKRKKEVNSKKKSGGYSEVIENLGIRDYLDLHFDVSEIDYETKVRRMRRCRLTPKAEDLLVDYQLENGVTGNKEALSAIVMDYQRLLEGIKDIEGEERKERLVIIKDIVKETMKCETKGEYRDIHCSFAEEILDIVDDVKKLYGILSSPMRISVVIIDYMDMVRRGRGEI